MEAMSWRRGGSTNASGCPGRSARRRAISAATRAGASDSSTSQSGNAPTTTASAGEPVAPRQRDREELQRERPAGAGGRIGRHAGGKVAGHDQRAGRHEDLGPGAREQPVGEHVVGDGPVRVDAAGDDLAHRVGDDDVDPLERGHDCLVRRGQRRRVGHDPDIAATARARLVDEPAQDGERALGAARDRLSGRVERVEAATRRRLRPPALHGRGGSGGAIGELTARRDVHADQLGARVDRGPGLIEGVDDGRRPEPGPDPRSRRVPEHRQQLAASRPVRVHAVHRGAGQRRRVGHRDRAPVGLREQLRLEPEVHVPCRDRQRELLRGEVVLGQGHRERQRDPAAEAARVRGEVAVDDLGRERTAVAVEPADAEQPQDRPLLPDRGGRRGTGSPGGGELRSPARAGPRGRGLRQLLHGRQYGWRPTGGASLRQSVGGSAEVRATWPTQTWPSVKRSAFQIGARAFVSSIA